MKCAESEPSILYKQREEACGSVEVELHLLPVGIGGRSARRRIREARLGGRFFRRTGQGIRCAGRGTRRVGIIDLDFDVVANTDAATRASAFVRVPSRFPSAVVDLAFVTPRSVHAADLALALRRASELVESVKLFDVYEGPGLAEGSRSLAYSGGSRVR